MRRANGAFGRISAAPFHMKGASINNVPESLPGSGKYPALTARLQFVVCTGVYTIAEPGRNEMWPAVVGPSGELLCSKFTVSLQRFFV
jgi:hypothetical protein